MNKSQARFYNYKKPGPTLSSTPFMQIMNMYLCGHTVHEHKIFMYHLFPDTESELPIHVRIALKSNERGPCLMVSASMLFKDFFHCRYLIPLYMIEYEQMGKIEKLLSLLRGKQVMMKICPKAWSSLYDVGYKCGFYRGIRESLIAMRWISLQISIPILGTVEHIKKLSDDLYFFVRSMDVRFHHLSEPLIEAVCDLIKRRKIKTIEGKWIDDLKDTSPSTYKSLMGAVDACLSPASFKKKKKKEEKEKKGKEGEEEKEDKKEKKSNIFHDDIIKKRRSNRLKRARYDEEEGEEGEE